MNLYGCILTKEEQLAVVIYLNDGGVDAEMLCLQEGEGCEIIENSGGIVEQHNAVIL